MRNPPLILVVDDDENFSEIITTKLKASGFETAAAATAEKGIAEAARLLPDLILMDIQLASGPPGTEVALTIKENPETEHVKIAFLTNYKDPFPGMSGTPDEITQELGMDDFLDKTSDLNALVEKIRAILGRSATTLPNSDTQSGGETHSLSEQGSSGELPPGTPSPSSLLENNPAVVSEVPAEVQGGNIPSASGQKQ